MEIRRTFNTKYLHHHAAALGLLLISVFTAATLYAYNAKVTNLGQTLARALVTKNLNIKPSSNGLATITVNKPKASNAGQDLNQLGSEAEVDFTFQSYGQ